jgi:exopolyphosphatase/pppGpp-phosphohydrolase
MKNENMTNETNVTDIIQDITNKSEKPAKKAKTPKSGTMTTRDMAKIVGMTPKALRRILRDTTKYDDGKYTKYALTQADLENVKKKIAGK